MNWKEFVTDYLSFTRRDRIGILVIILLIVSIFFLPDLLAGANTKKITTDTAWLSAIKNIEQKEVESGQQYAKNDDENNAAVYQYDRSSNNYSTNNYNKAKGELFYFDPNTISAEEWQRLGLRDKTIGTIQNFLSKGGKFRKPEDLQKIYGLFPNEFERIAPYIKIEAAASTATNFKNDFVKEDQPVKTYAPRYSVVDINSADTTTLIALPGIGSKLAMRIITFRDKLGGFYSINQVGETFGLADSVFQKIKQYLKLENAAVKKININTATADELKSHPYIRYVLANPIIAYRNEHGTFGKIEDLKKIMAVTDEVYKKIAAYLSVQ